MASLYKQTWMSLRSLHLSAFFLLSPYMEIFYLSASLFVLTIYNVLTHNYPIIFIHCPDHYLNKVRKQVLCILHAFDLTFCLDLQLTCALLVQQGCRTGYHQMMTWHCAALAGNRTRVNCLGSSYAIHYTTNACNQLCKCLKATLPPAWEMYKFCALNIVNIKCSICSNFPSLDSKPPNWQCHWFSSADSCSSKYIPNWNVASNETLLRWPGIEPGSTAWKAAMFTTIPPTHILAISVECHILLCRLTKTQWSESL